MSADDDTRDDAPKASDAARDDADEGDAAGGATLEGASAEGASAEGASAQGATAGAAESDADVSTTALSLTAPQPSKRPAPRVEVGDAAETAASSALERARAIAMKSLRRWRTAAIVSLSLNVFILGIVAGGAILRPRFPGPGGMGGPGRAPPFTVRGAEVALGERVRDRVAALEQAHKKAIDDALEQLRVRADEVDAVLLGDPLDQPKLDAALAALRKANDAFQAELHLEFRDLVTGLTLEERRRLSEAGKRLGPGKRPKRPRP